MVYSPRIEDVHNQCTCGCQCTCVVMSPMYREDACTDVQGIGVLYWKSSLWKIGGGWGKNSWRTVKIFVWKVYELKRRLKEDYWRRYHGAAILVRCGMVKASRVKAKWSGALLALMREISRRGCSLIRCQSPQIMYGKKLYVQLVLHCTDWCTCRTVQLCLYCGSCTFLLCTGWCLYRLELYNLSKCTWSGLCQKRFVAVL